MLKNPAALNLLKNRLQNLQILSGYLFTIGATALWSGNFIIARGLNESIPPVSLAFWRWVVAVIVFLPFAFKPLFSQRDVLKNNIGYLAITSLLGITKFNTLIIRRLKSKLVPLHEKMNRINGIRER